MSCAALALPALGRVVTIACGSARAQLVIRRRYALGVIEQHTRWSTDYDIPDHLYDGLSVRRRECADHYWTRGHGARRRPWARPIHLTRACERAQRGMAQRRIAHYPPNCTRLCLLVGNYVVAPARSCRRHT